MSSDWEFSKENIRPLKQGRKMDELQHTLQTDDYKDFKLKLMKERQQFEANIRTYDGDDPLDCWHKYIEWIEQNFPKGGKSTSLDKILYNCILKFKDDPKYADDDRFVDIFLKFAAVSPNPVETYQFMYSVKIACKSAKFFRCWANHLESTGNLKDADAVILEGLLLNAEPKEELKLLQMHISTRAVQCSNNVQQVDDLEAQRTALGNLKSFGSKNKVGVTRTGAAQRKTAENVQDRKRNDQTTSKIAFQPYQDENQLGSKEFGKLNEAKGHLILDGNQENEKKPCKWTKAKVPVKHLQQSMQTKFDIHVDPAVSQTAPKHVTVMDDKVLSATKAVCDANKFPLTTNAKSSSKILKEVYICCIDKLFCGGTEFQFEELRAIKWKQMNKKKEDHIEKINPDNSLKNKDVLEEREKAVLKVADKEKINSPTKTRCSKSDFIASTNFNQPLPAPILPSEKNKNLDTDVRKIENVPEYTTTCLNDVNLESVKPKGLNARPQSDAKPGLNMFGYPNSEANPVRVREPSEENKINPLGACSFMNSLWNASVSDPIAEFIKEESRLIRDLGPENNFNHNAKPKFTIFTDDEVLPTMAASAVFKPVQNDNVGIIQNSEKSRLIEGLDAKNNFQKPKFAIFCDDDAPQSVVKTKSILQKQTEDDEIIKILPLKDIVIDDGAPPANILVPLNDFTVAFEDTEIYSDFRQKPVEVSMSCVSNTAFFRNINIASTPSRSAGGDAEVVNKKKQLPDVKFDKPISFRFEDDDKRHSNNFYRRNSGRFMSLGLSPISEASRESKSSSSSGMSSTVAALSHGRSRFMRRFTQEEIPTLDEKLIGSHQSNVYIVDPFDDDVINNILSNCEFSVNQTPGFATCDDCIPKMTEGASVNIGEDVYRIEEQFGHGAFAKVYCAGIFDSNSSNPRDCRCVALKVQRPACAWEYYISREIIYRVLKLNEPYNVLPSIVNIFKFYQFNNGSVAVMDYYPYGTLLDVVNYYKQHRTSMPECLTLYFTIEILSIIQQIHSCGIIHADFKPDNVLLMTLPSLQCRPSNFDFKEVFGTTTQSIKIIDYGRSIDLSVFQPNVIFNHQVQTDGFMCPAMLENKPWTYQIDFFGIAQCIHVMLFSKYLKIQKFESKYVPQGPKLNKRFWNVEVWETILDNLINIPDTCQQPNLSSMISLLTECLMTKKMINEFPKKVKELNDMMFS